MTETAPNRLELLYRVSQAFNSTLELDHVLEIVMDEVIVATRAERGFLMLRQPDGELNFRSARGMDQRTIDQADFHISRSVVDRVADAGQPLLTSNALMDARFDNRQSIQLYGLRSILCVPLQVKARTIGVIYVDNRLQSSLFRNEDLDLLVSIASSAAIAIENARLYQLAVEKGRIERELQMARQVQSSLMPRSHPDLPGWDLAAHWQPARQVSGDYYDVIQLAPDRLGLVIADVSDKGLPAALFMTLTRSTLRASLAHELEPCQAISQANRLISADSTGGTFVTLFYACLNAASGKLVYVNAGHNPPLHYTAANDSWQILPRTGMALGVDETVVYTQRSLDLSAGDFIFMYTDGVTDATDAAQQAFGEDNLRSVIWANRRASTDQMVAAVRDALHEFCGTSDPFDDITLLILKRDSE